MTQAATSSYREDVEQLRRRFAEFRSTHAVRSRLPEELWAVAAKPVAQPRPRRQVRQRRAGSAASAVPAFVELLAQTTGAAPTCLVEVESQGGAKLRLEIKAVQVSTLVELIRAFAAS